MMISSTSKPTHMDSGKSIPTPASDRSTDQPDSAGDLDQEDVYVEVTILAKKVGKTGNTIQLKQFLVSSLILLLRALKQSAIYSYSYILTNCFLTYVYTCMHVAN